MHANQRGDPGSISPYSRSFASFRGYPFILIPAIPFFVLCPATAGWQFNPGFHGHKGTQRTVTKKSSRTGAGVSPSSDFCVSTTTVQTFAFVTVCVDFSTAKASKFSTLNKIAAKEPEGFNEERRKIGTDSPAELLFLLSCFPHMSFGRGSAALGPFVFIRGSPSFIVSWARNSRGEMPARRLKSLLKK